MSDELDAEDLAILKKYGINHEEERDHLEEWLSNISYLCYIVEKNTNMFIDDNTNMIQVFDRADSIEYESKIYEEKSNKIKNGSRK